MNVKIKGNFKRIIYAGNNFNVFSFKLFPNQNNEKSVLDISNNSNYINVISQTRDIDLTLDYEIDIKIETKNHSKYKYNYWVESKNIIIPNEKEGVIKFLSSSLFKGINEKSATKLVDQIGFDFLEKVNEYEGEIIKILGNKKGQIIIDGINNKNEFNELSKEFLMNNFSMLILNLINSKTKQIKKFLESEIFFLINETVDVDFLELDKIAKYYLKDYSLSNSNDWLVLYSIKKIENLGSTVNGVEAIYKQANLLRTIEKETFKMCLKKLFENNKIIIHENKTTISSMSIFMKEKFIVDKIFSLSQNKMNSKITEDSLITNNLDEFQKQTLISSLSNCFTIITGGPGTGKTLLIDLILKNLKKNKIKKIEVLTPTGKAATQIIFRTNESAKTFHSFLKWNEKEFEINENKPSDVEVIIIDEFSMVNIELFYSLLVACPKLKQLIIVGDKDQLPSIGPGYLLNDLIISNKFNVFKLEKIYRQSEGSLIAQNSVLINNNKLPIFDENESTFYELKEEDFKDIIKVNIEMHIRECNDMLDHQILIPMYAGTFGIDEVNNYCQSFLNKDKEPLFILNNKNYYKEDKVIQLENINEKDVFNGEIGKIEKAYFDKNNEINEIEILFSFNKRVKYTVSEFNKNVKLAYAISVHKFQGSECSNVIFLLSNDHYPLLSKKLFYTGYTRAKKSICIISTLNIIEYCINHDIDSNRNCNIIKLIEEKSN